MAAYGALVSVMQIMDQIHRHPHPPISLNKKQSESLAANVSFLQEFLEGYNPHVSYSEEADPLESRIAEAAYAAEDVIESYIVDQIHSRSSDHAEEISSVEFYQGLEKVIEEMDLIKMDIKKEMKEKKKMGVQIIKKKSTSDDAGSYRSPSTAQKVTTMVGFDDVLYEMLDKITGGERGRQIIPIVGMGGLGKTTLARNIYAHPLIKEHFEICAWSTISQVHNSLKVLREIIDQVDKPDNEDNDWRNSSDHELGEKLYKLLIGRRYFIVMDDMWSIEAWDRVKRFFPNNEKGSRIVVTTRLSNLASKFNCFDSLDMKFLDDASSWDLFSQIVFGEEICPPELEAIGKKIVDGCSGLPLSIVVVGGLLSKSEPTQGNWEVIKGNLSSVVNSEDDGSCLQILYTSYNNLPAHIKPCFLYFGVFDEDRAISVSCLIYIWVLEGFIKPFEGKSLEEVAENCIEGLVDRNLVFVAERNQYGKPKRLIMHDLVRDVCLREAQKDKFLCSLKQSTKNERFQGMINYQRRIVTSDVAEDPPNLLFESLEPASSHVRTLIGEFPTTLYIPNFKLLRVRLVDSLSYSEEVYIRLVNLRYIVVDHKEHSLSWIPSMWNLQILFFSGVGEDYNLEIWKMPQLRSVLANYYEPLCLSDPPLSGDDMDEVVLENLHTLSEVRNLNLGEEVIKRIPNIRILKLFYEEEEEEEEEVVGDYCINNLHCLCKLQALRLRISYSLSSHLLMRELTLPYSLKTLTLDYTELPWEEMASRVGCLPLLQVLKLKRYSFIGSKWETVEGQFSTLKFLLIGECDLEYWMADNTHFPRLEHLVLCDLLNLREIPSSIGDIPTLLSIRVEYCGDQVEESARRIIEEQEELDNQDIQLQVK